MTKAYQELETYLETAQALQTALTLFEWDNETLAPKEAGAYTGKMIGALSGEYFRIMTDEKGKALIKACKEETDLSEVETAIVREVEKEQKRLDCIPADEYREFAELTSESARIWAKARKEKDFKAFAPVLKKILDYQKRFASYQAKEGQKLYDVMLKNFEEDFDMKSLDQFFAMLKERLVPFLKQLTDSKRVVDDSFLTGDYSEEKQEEIGRFLAEYVGFDFDKGVMAVSAHPFTTNLHNHDVRITTAYNDHVDDSIFSVIHECGHGIYEMGIPNELTQTPVGQGISMGMH